MPPVTASSLAELQLAHRARDGDQAALAELYHRYRGPLHRHACRMLGNEAAAHDVVQESFVRAMAAMPRTEGDLKFKAWIYRIATNLCLKQLNQGNRWSPGGQEQVEMLPASAATGDPERGRRGTEIAEFVVKALEQLPPRYRQILVLRELDELSYDELARVLDLDNNRVKVTLHRARSRFAALFITARLRAEPSEVQCPELATLLAQTRDRRPIVAHLEQCDHCRRQEHRPAAELFAMLPPIAVPDPTTLPIPVAATAKATATWTLGLGLAALVPAGVAALVLTLSPAPENVEMRSRLAAPVTHSPTRPPAPIQRAPHETVRAVIPAAVTPTTRPMTHPRRDRPHTPSPPTTVTPHLRLKLRFLPGTVSLYRGSVGEPQRRLSVDRKTPLQLRDELQTAAGHSVGLLLPGDQWIIARGRLRLDAVPAASTTEPPRQAAPGVAGDVQVTLLRGELGAGITVQSGDRRITVEGGELRLRLGAARLQIESLSAYVTARGPHAQRTVPPGSRLTLDLSTARAGFVQRLLPAPRELRPVLASGPRPPRLHWQAVTTARRYRVQIARDAQFMELEHTTQVAAPAVDPPPLPRGKHFWQVTALDGTQPGLGSKIFSFTIE